MPDEPRKLSLHQAPVKAIKSAVEVLSKWLDLSLVRLGGGTALEARWHHRKSTDLDFFATGDEIDELFYNRYDKVYDDLISFRNEGVIAESGASITGRNVIHFVIGETPISLARTDRFHTDPCDEIEEQTGVFLNSTRDIISKKLIDRLCYSQVATDRDAYDFLVAQSFAPGDLGYGWNLLDSIERSRVIDICQYRIDGMMNQRSGSSELSDARYPYLIEDLWNHAKRLFESNLDYMPSLYG